MEKRERISKTSKVMILAAAVLADVFLFLFGSISALSLSASIVPLIGPAISLLFSLLGSAGTFMISLVWNIVLVLWLMGIGVGLKRLWVRVGVMYALGAVGLLFSMFPFLGGLVSAGIVFINTLILYFLIRAVEKEDKEYNELQERKERELERAKSAKKRKGIEAQYREQERQMQEKSILNKKHA